MTRPSLALVVAAALLSSVPIDAHHSFGGTYDVSKTITIKGKMVQVTLRAPHSFLYVEVEDADGFGPAPMKPTPGFSIVPATPLPKSPFDGISMRTCQSSVTTAVQ